MKIDRVMTWVPGAALSTFTVLAAAESRAESCLSAASNVERASASEVDYVYGSDVYLGNALDYLAIQTNDLTPLVIDVTEWDENSGLDPAGRSRSLDPNFMSAADNDNDTNFCEATSLIVGGTDYGTPGMANDSCAPVKGGT